MVGVLGTPAPHKVQKLDKILLKSILFWGNLSGVSEQVTMKQLPFEMANSVITFSLLPLIIVSIIMVRVWSARAGALFLVVVSDLTFHDVPHCFRSPSPNDLRVSPSSAGLTRTFTEGSSLVVLMTSLGAATTGRITSLRVFQVAGSLIEKCERAKSQVLKEASGADNAKIGAQVIETATVELACIHCLAPLDSFFRDMILP